MVAGAGGGGATVEGATVEGATVEGATVGVAAVGGAGNLTAAAGVWSTETFSNGPAIFSRTLFWRILMPI
jgi:hypothetical protein